LCAAPIPNVANEPPAHCVFIDFTESYCRYAVRYWLTDLSRDAFTNSVVRERVFFALKRATIPLSIPAQTVFVTSDNQERRARKQTEETNRRIEALKKLEIFRALTDEEYLHLANHLRVAPFLQGETITRQGADAHWLYIIVTGKVEVTVSLNDGNPGRRVNILSDGDFFGEGGMMTGEKRAATVVALTDTECYRLDREAFSSIILNRKEIATDISKVMARRRAELDAVKEDLDEDAKKQRMHDQQGDILHRILHFFESES
jgi:CRP-like cAMP-binding protein